MKDEQTQKVSDNRKKKEVIVADVQEKVDKAKALVFTNYQGLTHQQLESMKKDLKKLEAEFVVIKNTLMLRTLADKNLDDSEKEKFQQPTGTLFIYNDIVGPLKSLSKMIKEIKLPSVKFGLIDGRVVDEVGVLKLATLPPAEVLRAQFLGLMLSPIQGLHRALTWNQTRLVMTLQAVSDKKKATSS